MRARDVMTSPVITLRPDVPVHLAAALLASHGFTAAPVVDQEHRVVGIATCLLCDARGSFFCHARSYPSWTDSVNCHLGASNLEGDGSRHTDQRVL